jgi:hypothetical protein
MTTNQISCFDCGELQQYFWCSDCMTKWINEQASK